ncbi:MAG: flagellin [Pseudomonadota bacterium]
MASILTNTSAMVALQNLRTINSNLVGTQNEIATGKKIANAQDNSAIWAVSKVIESDVNAFKAIGDSLNLGDSTVAVARQAAETISDILTEMKGNIVAAQEENVDRTKIQADIDAKVEQVQAIVEAASFNGLNLVQGSEEASVLGSLQRDGSGTVTASEVAIARQDLTTRGGQLGTGAGTTDLSANITASSATISSDAVRDDGAGTAADITLAGDASLDSLSFNIDGTTISFGVGELDATAATAAGQIASAINAAQIDGVTVNANGAVLEFSSTRAFESVLVDGTATGGNSTLTADVTLGERAESFTIANVNVNEGDGYQISLSGGGVATYVAGANETSEDIARGLQLAINSNADVDISTQVVQDAGQWVLKIDNNGSADQTATIVANDDANDNAIITGGLSGLEGFDVTTNEGASAALSQIDTLLNESIDAASAFGSIQARIGLQAEFVSKLTDSLKTGIGSLVDADLEAASARLQALQVQQQLGIQSLSIANQAPQSILALFR